MHVRKLDAEKKAKTHEIVAALKRKMQEMDNLAEKIREKAKEVPPKETSHLLEEIKVPPLKALKEDE